MRRWRRQGRLTAADVTLGPVGFERPSLRLIVASIHIVDHNNRGKRDKVVISVKEETTNIVCQADLRQPTLPVRAKCVQLLQAWRPRSTDPITQFGRRSQVQAPNPRFRFHTPPSCSSWLPLHPRWPHKVHRSPSFLIFSLLHLTPLLLHPPYRSSPQICSLRSSTLSHHKLGRHCTIYFVSNTTPSLLYIQPSKWFPRKLPLALASCKPQLPSVTLRYI